MGKCKVSFISHCVYILSLFMCILALRNVISFICHCRLIMVYLRVNVTYSRVVSSERAVTHSRSSSISSSPTKPAEILIEITARETMSLTSVTMLTTAMHRQEGGESVRLMQVIGMTAATDTLHMDNALVALVVEVELLRPHSLVPAEPTDRNVCSLKIYQHYTMN